MIEGREVVLGNRALMAELRFDVAAAEGGWRRSRRRSHRGPRRRRGKLADSSPSPTP